MDNPKMIKRIKIILLLVIAPLLSQAQSLFGFSPSEIRSKRQDVEWEYGKWGKDNDFLTMSFTKDNLRVTYLFDDSNLSVFTIAKPLTAGSLQALVEIYNKKYIIINSYTWEYYGDGSIYHCDLKQTDDGDYYFLWSLK